MEEGRRRVADKLEGVIMTGRIVVVVGGGGAASEDSATASLWIVVEEWISLRIV